MSEKSDKMLFVSEPVLGGINGAFTISAYITVDGRRQLIGRHVEMGRANRSTSADGTLQGMVARFSLADFTEDEVENGTFDVEVTGQEKTNTDVFGKFRSLVSSGEEPYKLEVA